MVEDLVDNEHLNIYFSHMVIPSSVEIVNSLRVLNFSSTFQLLKFTIRVLEYSTIQLLNL